MSRFVLPVVCLLLPLAVFAADSGKGQAAFAAEFAKHWSVAKDLAVSVAEAMPPEDYEFKPNPAEMSFGQQIAHIAQANYGYCSALNKSKSPFAKPANLDKAAAVKLVGDSFDYCSGIVADLTDEQLGETRGPEGRQNSVREVLLAVLTHMAHHRGQAEVYLRVKGITPPSYKF